MSELVYDFSPQGKVQGMHHDCFNLGFLGAQSIQRASDIRFDTDTQTWGIWLAQGEEFVSPAPALSGFNSYETARKFEVQALNACRLFSASALEEMGIKIIQALRNGVEL